MMYTKVIAVGSLATIRGVVRVFGLTLMMLLGPAAQCQVSAATKPQISVGPNILVSRDGDIAHCETMIAANPKNPKNLIGGSIVLIRPDGSPVDKPYVSFDGGATWADITLPEEMEAGSGDPQVGFGITGTAYFVALSVNGMNFYRSEDGGKSWSKGLSLGRHNDHEMLATDDTFGPYAGRLYITAEADVPGSKEIEDLHMRRRVVLFRSADDGRTFLGPIEIARGDNTGMSAENPLVLSDGTLFIPILEYPNYAIDKDADTWNLTYSLSHDGGITFSQLQPITTIHFGGVRAMRAAQQSGRVDQMGGPVFAVDREGEFRDRIYAAWTELESNRYRLMLTWSKDRGKTWSKPKPVDPETPAYASQFQPMIAVDPEGDLGIMWFDTDGFPKRDQFVVSFTASIDGGETFLRKRRISSDLSHPFGSGNLRPGPMVMSERGIITADFVSGISRWVNGGDYIGMTADTDGVFHPFWTDARSGTYQLYTAPVRVIARSHATATASDGTAVPAAEKQSWSISDKVTLVFDPVQYDPQSREVAVPVRLKNISNEPLYPPFRVEIKEFAHPYTIKAHEEVNAPTILNASNHKDGIGAVFDYSEALGDLESLEPGGVTNAILWRMRAASAVETNFHLGVEITGFVNSGHGIVNKAE